MAKGSIRRRWASRSEPEHRALRAFTQYREGHEYTPASFPTVFWAWQVTHDGKTYVLVGIDPVAGTPGYEVLAVYQVYQTDLRRRSYLLRLKRWPKAIEDMPTEDQVRRRDRRYRFDRRRS